MIRPAVADPEPYELTTRNAALANKVAELAGYRSEFFGKLRQVLGERPDIQIVGDRFVYVRGLGERYSQAQLDGSTLPTPEPEKRVLPLDIFPAAMIASEPAWLALSVCMFAVNTP